jgi:hypothetical protein
MDAKGMWEDTLLMVSTDHGFLLGEHNRWAKNIPTMWNEIARTPFFVWDPRTRQQGERRTALVQPAIDIGPTLLNFFGQEITPDMTGKDLAPVIRDDSPVRDAAVFGYFGLPVHCTDGQHVYMRYPEHPDTPLYEYSWMPTTMRERFEGARFEGCELSEPLPFSKGIPVPRFLTPAHVSGGERHPHRLYHIESDPAQNECVRDERKEAEMILTITGLLQEACAPASILHRYGLS